MENFSQKYAAVQIKLIATEKAAVAYEEGAQNEQDSQKLVTLFSDFFNQFCELLADYLKMHHKNFVSSLHHREMLENAHKAGFLAEHDTKILLQACKEKDMPISARNEVPLIHNIETYIKTMQTIMSEIKP